MSKNPRDDQKRHVYEPPESTAGDVAHLAARAVIASIPIVGGAGVEIFAAIVQPPLDRRRNEWMKEIGDALSELEQTGVINLSSLQEDDGFLDIVLSASQIALRTSQQEKKDALRNAILNATLPHVLDESHQQFFLHLVDTFTIWHLRLLKLFQNPMAWFREYAKPWPDVYAGGLSQILEAAYPELAPQRDFYDQIWRDLNTYGLVLTSGLHTTMTGRGLEARRTSSLGDEFLTFINEPM